mmetsp:Transcript_24013/g.58866  ORF Transcript_24013/g.58866 Transcript_24013/m.58866 type:complete len:237 (+) Transcript_24013:141-851(+)
MLMTRLPLILERCASAWSGLTSSGNTRHNILPLMSTRTTRVCTSTSMRLVSMYFPTCTSSTTDLPSSLSSSLNLLPPSLHCRMSSRLSGSSGKPSRRTTFLLPSMLKYLSWCSFFFTSCSSLCLALSRCSATRVAGHHGRSSSGMAIISATSSSSAARSRASDTFMACSMSTPSARSSFSSLSVMPGSSCLARIRSEGVTFVPSSFFSCGRVPKINCRYPPKSAHGLPMRYRSSSL